MTHESRLRIRVRYVECDPMGFLHHSAYLPYFEMGRTELLRQNGFSYRDIEDSGVLFVVTRVAVKYRKPARFDDVVELVTRHVKQTHVRINHEYELWRITEASGGTENQLATAPERELLCTAETTIASINRAGEVIQIPEGIGRKGRIGSGDSTVVV